jgi:hypothetical protein
MASGGGGGGGLSKTQKAINSITLERLEREEAKLVSDEAERQRLLSAGRFGRTSLLTGGFLGPGSNVRVARAVSRSNEQAKPSRGRGSGRRRKSERLVNNQGLNASQLQTQAFERIFTFGAG